MARRFVDDLVIVLAGEAGQGIQSIEHILAHLLKRSGYHYFSASEFMSRVRGGANSTEIRVSSKQAAGFLERIDLLIPLHKESIARLEKRMTPDTVVIGEKEKLNVQGMIDIPFTKMAMEIGNAVFANTVAAGCLCGLLNVGETECADFIGEYFSGKREEIKNGNLAAIKKGYAAGRGLAGIRVEIRRNTEVRSDLLLTGSDAVALGALAGGCDYVCGYPMSPSTGVLEKMAEYSKKFAIIVEQVEDEVGVVNMALGAWYAGARALVTTSGGGLALMGEGISLGGMIESPLVVHLAQRPGPATGLPTRTEQGDLDLVLSSGHGDFPRIILAPGTMAEGFALTQKAFNLAAKYQVPVFVLTDQYFVDSRCNTPLFSLDHVNVEKSIVETDEDYQRFALTNNGVSARGLPGYGSGTVCVDSDEHDESGQISEDLDLRTKMVDKRLRKFAALRAEIIPPRLVGSEHYRTLILCWGSTFNTVSEAVDVLGDKEIAVLHFSWVFPLPENTGDYLKKASRVIVVENNSSASMARLIKQTTGYAVENRVLKYNGLPFAVEEVKNEIQKLMMAGGSHG
ncbi:MAG: 2-oxoacid:acceptor oxidoreductase subunit alpha [Candidatus Aminicenantes bacterium]|nr:2-oxoacid:acceptor oxidoreductase subunit alpha [Candidatus Aminicenantes bacterium]